jgi:hypothetical protein
MAWHKDPNFILGGNTMKWGYQGLTKSEIRHELRDFKEKEIIKSQIDEVKQCFCIGADKCNDADCRLVREYRRNHDV